MGAQQQPLAGMEQLTVREGPPTTPMQLFELVKSGADAAAIEKLWQVQKEWDAYEAKRKFDEAFAQFKRNAPEILKTKHVSFPTKGGDRTDYWHAELDKISDIITEALMAVGIIQTWKSSDAGGKTTVTCILKGFGHTEEGSTLSGPADTSGGKNNIQAIGSTNFYLQRYTLLSTCGLVPKGVDNDGKTQGLSKDAIADFCTKMRDSSSWEELKAAAKEALDAAKATDDFDAREQFRKVYEARKREL